MVIVRKVRRKSAVLSPSSIACLSQIPTVNLTMGCAHGCLYCYTRGYRAYPGEGKLDVYENTLERLQAELGRKRRKPDAVYFSPASDLFQPVPDVLDMAYEPLIVRPHPSESERFQLINGHHRLQVLNALSHGSAKCVVWDIDDDQTRLYLATLNRLSGEDIPERRALLIGSLLEHFDLDELVSLLPEDHDQLAELERLAKVDSAEILTPAREPNGDAPRIILEFFLSHEHAKEVNLALDLVAHRCPDAALARSDALLQMARSYLAALPFGTYDSPAIDEANQRKLEGSPDVRTAFSDRKTQ